MLLKVLVEMFEHHKKLNPKAPKEPKYLSWLHTVRMPSCFACGTMVSIEMHHIKKNSTDERNDQKILPLCREHHHGTKLSPHGNAKSWRYSFTMDEQLNYAEELYNEYKKEK